MFSIIVLTLAIFFILSAFLLKKFPPDFSNPFYGYRTPLSTKNKENWDFAQRLSIKKSGECAIISIALSVLGLLFSANYQINIVAIFLYLIFVVYYTVFNIEKALRKFDKKEKI